MAYRCGERYQQMLFPSRIDDYISQEDPVRVYDAFVDALDMKSLAIVSAPHQPGCPPYCPSTMLKILVYAYSYGFRSSRKIQRALHHNLSFIWLAGGLKPNYRTIARFRKDNVKALKQVIKQCARLCLKLNVIAGNTLFVDGTKMRANAGIANTRNRKDSEAYLEKLNQRIDQLLLECEQIDRDEEKQASFVELDEALTKTKKLKGKVQAALEMMNSEGVDRINTTDPDCIRVNGRQGSHAGYNGQIVVDEKAGMIVHSDVVDENNDTQQFAHQIDQANTVLETPCQNACADTGYSTADELEKIDHQQIKVIVPKPLEVSGRRPSEFDKIHFTYIPEEDYYLCPANQRLFKYGHDASDKCSRYAASAEVCTACEHYGRCTTATKRGRTIIRYDNQEVRDKLAAQFEEAASQVIFSRRKETAELPFGHIKRNLGADHFLLRGLEGVRAEMSILSSCFNIARLIGKFGVTGLLGKLASI